MANALKEQNFGARTVVPATVSQNNKDPESCLRALFTAVSYVHHPGNLATTCAEGLLAF